MTDQSHPTRGLIPDHEPSAADLRIAALEGEVEALRKDAERYKWLKENHCNDDAGDGLLWFRFYSGDDYNGRTELLDAAIDAARAGKDQK